MGSSRSNLSHRSSVQRCLYCGCTVESKSSPQLKCNRCYGVLSHTAEVIDLETFHCGVIVDQKYESSGLSEEEKLSNTLRKYFSQKNSQVRRGIIFKAWDRNFKILHCHPPAGKVTSHTRIILTGPTGSITQLKNTSRIIRKLDLKPIRASLTPAKKSMKDSESLLPEIRKFFREEANSRLTHLSTGELFTTSSNIEFRIMKVESDGSEPGEDGIVDLQQTVIYCSGPPIDDIKSITLLPIYETLPNREKQFPFEKILETYIKPHTLGLSVYVQRLGEVRLNGVDFAITNCEPKSGILTCETVFRNTQPNIRAGAWRSQKMQEDEALARRLQGETPTFIFRASSGGLQGPSILTEALNRVRQQNLPGPSTGDPSPGPPMGVNPSMQMLSQLLTLLQNSNGQALSGPSKPNAAHLAPMLPTRKYKKNHNSSLQVSSTDELKVMDGSIPTGKESVSEDESTSGARCRICLDYYEDNVEVKTLPCFHIFHAECIDKWLQLSDECCICKTSVSASFRSLPQESM